MGSLSRDPALTYRGALQILGKYEHPVIEKLDLILGGLILGGGAAGAAAMLSPVLVPLAAFTAVWGWIEQRDEAVKLLRKALDGVSDKLMRTAGYERYQLVALPTPLLCAAAFFEALQEYLGAKEYKKLAITAAERKALTLGTFDDMTNRQLIELLYRTPVPTPSPVRGFEENIPEVRAWMDHIAATTQRFLAGLACWQSINRQLGSNLVQRAVERYRSYYLRMAATVPEFLVWASLGEHAATRNTVAEVRADVMAALAGQTGALARLENLLTIMAPHLVPAPDLCSTVNRANLGVLTESIVPEGASAPVAQVTFPTVERDLSQPALPTRFYG